jgi:hypothetical protein
MTNDIIDNAITDDDLERLSNATHDPNDFVGRPLKFTEGEWSIYTGRETPAEEINEAELFVVDVLSYANGIVKWVDRRPVERHIYRPIDGWILPKREQWPDRDEERWLYDNKLGKAVDPWQETHQIVLKRLQHDEYDDGLVTWSPTGYYALKSLRKSIKEDFVGAARKHPGMMPVVTLGTYDERSPTYGKIPAPLLTIVDWQPFGEGASGPGRRDAVPQGAALLMLGQLPGRRSDGKVIDAEVVETKTPPRRNNDDMDDQIPF